MSEIHFYLNADSSGRSKNRSTSVPETRRVYARGEQIEFRNIDKPPGKMVFFRMAEHVLFGKIKYRQ